MEYAVAILSGDADFRRMLELECQWMSHSCFSAERREGSVHARIWLLDLDDPEIDVPFDEDATVIGFTRRPGRGAEEGERRCSLVLHRPFSMRLLREELLRLLEEPVPCAKESVAQLQKHVLRLSGRLLSYGEASVLLTAREAALARCLLKHLGDTVSKARLDACLSTEEGNKTEVYVCHLRRKLKLLGRDVEIETVRGVGYRLNQR